MTRTRRLLLAPLVLVLTMVLASCGSEDEPDLADAKAGDCIATPAEVNAAWAIIECGSEPKDYKVLSVVDEVETEEGTASVCADEKDFDLSLSPVKGEKPTICLRQLAGKGDCIYQGRYIECADGGGSVVDAVIKGTNARKCPKKSTQSRVYKDAKRTVCVSPNKVKS